MYKSIQIILIEMQINQHIFFLLDHIVLYFIIKIKISAMYYKTNSFVYLVYINCIYEELIKERN